MANEYIVAKKSGEKSNGIIGLSLSVFESIAAFCVEDVEGFSLSPLNKFKKPVICKVEDQKIIVTVNISMKMGGNVNHISSAIQKQIVEGIEQITDFKDITVNVNVVGFYI